MFRPTALVIDKSMLCWFMSTIYIWCTTCINCLIIKKKRWYSVYLQQISKKTIRNSFPKRQPDEVQMNWSRAVAWFLSSPGPKKRPLLLPYYCLIHNVGDDSMQYFVAAQTMQYIHDVKMKDKWKWWWWWAYVIPLQSSLGFKKKKQSSPLKPLNG